jgi:hypothetical protein
MRGIIATMREERGSLELKRVDSCAQWSSDLFNQSTGQELFLHCAEFRAALPEFIVFLSVFVLA